MFISNSRARVTEGLLEDETWVHRSEIGSRPLDIEFVSKRFTRQPLAPNQSSECWVPPYLEWSHDIMNAAFLLIGI